MEVMIAFIGIWMLIQGTVFNVANHFMCPATTLAWCWLRLIVGRPLFLLLLILMGPLLILWGTHLLLL